MCVSNSFPSHANKFCDSNADCHSTFYTQKQLHLFGSVCFDIKEHWSFGKPTQNLLLLILGHFSLRNSTPNLIKMSCMFILVGQHLKPVDLLMLSRETCPSYHITSVIIITLFFVSLLTMTLSEKDSLVLYLTVGTFNFKQKLRRSQNLNTNFNKI